MSFIDTVRGLFNGSVKLSVVQPGQIIRGLPYNGEGKKNPAISSKIRLNNKSRADLGMEEINAAITSAEQPNLANRRPLLLLYNEIIKDAHLASVMRTRLNVSMSQPYLIINKDNKTVDTDRLELLLRPWFRQVFKHYLDSIFYGHSLIEFPEPSKNIQNKFSVKEFDKVTLIPRANVKPEYGIITLSEYDVNGFLYREAPLSDWILEAGDSHNLGLLHIALKEITWKIFGRKDWSRYNEKFGLPMVLVKTDDSNDTELTAKQDMLTNMGVNGWGIIGKDDDISLLTPSTSGNTVTLFENMVRMSNEEVSKLIVGQTMTSENGSSLSQAEVHERILNTLGAEDMRGFQDWVNFNLFPLLIKHGYPLQGFQFVFKIWLKEVTDPAYSDEPNADDLAKTKKPNQDQEDLSLNFHKPFSLAQLKGNLSAMYAESCGHVHLAVSPDEVLPASFSLEVIELFQSWAASLWNVRADKEQFNILLKTLNLSIYDAYANLLYGAFKKAYTGELGGRITDFDFTDAPNRFLPILKQNLYAFSAAKTYAQFQAIKDLIVKDGITSSYTDFRKGVSQIVGQFNEQWLQAEYQTTLRHAVMAAKWHVIEADKSVYGLLRYNTIGDNRVRPEHQGLNGITLPVDNTFWDKYFPPNGWRCRCTVEQLLTDSAPITPDNSPQLKVASKTTDKYFKKNPGKSRVFEYKNHPYFTAGPGNKNLDLKAEDNYGLRSYEAIYRNPSKLPSPDLLDSPEEYKAYWQQLKSENESFQKNGFLLKNKFTDSYIALGDELKRHPFDNDRRILEERWAIFKEAIYALEKPDEVWSTVNMHGFVDYSFLRYTKDGALFVPVNATKIGLEMETWFYIKSENLPNRRKGMLINRKT